MKSCSFKGPPKKKYLYKNFSIDTFNDTLKINLDNIKDNNKYGCTQIVLIKTDLMRTGANTNGNTTSV